jgi:hypothetical protein
MALSKTSPILTGLFLAAAAAAFSYWLGGKTQPQPRYRSQVVDRGHA